MPEPVTISGGPPGGLPPASTLDGTEKVAVDQGFDTVVTTALNIAKTLPLASESAAGKMSAADFAKLAGIEEGATAGGGGGGSGDVAGPASSIDGRAVVFSGTTGKVLRQAPAAPVLEGDGRLSDARTPSTHATSHGSGGSDPITVAQAQVTGLATALSGKETAGAAVAAVTTHEAAGDPHPQYLTAAEGNTAYAPASQGVTNGNSHDHNGGDGAQIAYGSLSGRPTLGGAAALDVGTGAGTVAAGNDSRFHSSVTISAELTPVFTLTGQALTAVDHGADRLLFWDDSAGTLAPLSLGTNLSITGTTLNAGGASVATVVSGTTSADIQSAFNAAADGGLVVIPPGTYSMTSAVTCTNKSLHVDARGAIFNVTANVRGFIFDNTSDAQLVSLTSNYTKGSNTLSVNALAAALPRGYWIKIVSDAVDPGNRDQGSTTSQFRVGEWAMLGIGSTTTTLQLASPLRFTIGVDTVSIVGDEPLIDAYTTAQSARVLVLARRTMSWVGGTIQYTEGNDATPWNSNAFSVAGYFAPAVDDLTILRCYQVGIGIRGNIDAVISRCDISGLTDNTGLGQFGYGLSEAGNVGTEVFGCSFKHGRHGYTTSNQPIVAGSTDKNVLIGSGRTQSSRIVSCSGSGPANGIGVFDTHMDAQDVTFVGCTVTGGGTAFATRGRNITVSDCRAVNVTTGISVFTDFSGGQPDDDTWSSNMTIGATTCTINNIDIECSGVPIDLNGAGDVRLNSARLKSLSSMFIDNSSSRLYISGQVYCETSNVNGNEAIYGLSNKGVLDHTGAAITPSLAWKTFTRIMPGCSFDVKCADAISGTNNLYLFRGASFISEGQFFIEGTVTAELSSAFVGLSNRTLTGSPTGSLIWSMAGASDDSIVRNTLLGSYIKASTKDGTVIHDWATKDLKTYIKAPVGLTHTGTGALVTDAIKIPYEPVDWISEAGHTVQTEVYMRFSSTAGTSVITCNSGGDFMHSFTVPSTVGIGVLKVTCNTRGATDSLWLLEFNGYSGTDIITTGCNAKYTLEVTNWSPAGGWLNLDINAATGRVITVDQYSITSDLLSINVA